MKRRLYFAAALAAGLSASIPIARAQDVWAGEGSVAIRGNVTWSTINVGVPLEKIDALVKERTKPLEDLTASQKQAIDLLQEKLDLNERQTRAALDILGEKDIPREALAAKLVEIAQGYKTLRATALAQPGDDPGIAALKADAQKAIEAGELAKADALLADIEAEQQRALDRVTINVAETAARRGDIAMTRLRYGEAARQYGDAAAVFSSGGAHEDKRLGYLERQADAHYTQGGNFGDSGALQSAIEEYRRLVDLRPRERVPLDWARMQTKLGNALVHLGKWESGTARFEEGIAAIGEALKEATRKRAPAQWAVTQATLGYALSALGGRQKDTARLQEAVAAYRAALGGISRKRGPLIWAGTQSSLASALQAVGLRESGTARLEEAVAALREGLTEATRERAPQQWAMMQTNLGNVLRVLAEREGGTARLEEAVAAFDEALKERSRERLPFWWAVSTDLQGVARMRLAERTNDAAMAQAAVAQLESALDFMRTTGDAQDAAAYKERLAQARALVERLGNARQESK